MRPKEETHFCRKPMGRHLGRDDRSYQNIKSMSVLGSCLQLTPGWVLEVGKFRKVEGGALVGRSCKGDVLLQMYNSIRHVKSRSPNEL